VSTELALLIALVVVGAMWLVVHVAVVWKSFRAREIAWYYRLLALIPLAAPGVAWVAGSRVAPIVWGVLGAAYVTLRVVAS
jgi:hypothetical protein